MIGLSDADFWGMTPKSYAAVQKAYTRLHFGAAPSDEDQAKAEAGSIHAKFTAMAAAQQARKAAGGDV